MKHSRLALASVALSGLLWQAPASAEERFEVDLRPGLWQHSFTMKSESGQMEQAIEEALRQLEQLPQSQRRMVEEMMASQGINLGLAGSSVEVCITDEQLREGTLPQQEGCEQTVTQEDDDTYFFEFQCAGDPPYSGSGHLTRIDREHYTGTAEFTTRMGGNPERITMHQEGQWIAEECE
ncbi:MAG: DUF3617 domain-containing protein [Idiomarina sp.]|nr:DUF3617 domain-containing protein [Idiomarina sp.]